MPAAAEELKHVIVLNTHTDSSGKPSTNPQVQCVHCSHTFEGGATRIRGSAEKLVYISLSNLRLLKKLQSVSYKEECWSWEEESNDSDIDA